ncbi:MAG: threonine aldolase family protein [Hyphomicrobiaceae bacterium]
MTTPITIDLISDTATKPTAGMREAMARAEVGDEQRGEDPSVNMLCGRVAELLGKQAAVYLPSGIMSNLIAILVHCKPGDEIIAAGNAHIISSEGAGASALAGAMITTICTPDGRFTSDQFAKHIRPLRPRAPRTRLVSIEQTSNKGGGTVWSETAIRDIAEAAGEHDIKCHMDGARLFNASVATKLEPSGFSRYCDSVWVDLSKGLGCPVGSVLAGSKNFIEEAWVWKHRLGGAMRQAGVLAAAGLYALDHHVERLADDHENARRLAKGLATLDSLKIVGEQVETNIVFINVTDTGQSALDIARHAATKGVRVGAVSDHVLRAVTHLDLTTQDIDHAIAAFCDCC